MGWHVQSAGKWPVKLQTTVLKAILRGSWQNKKRWYISMVKYDFPFFICHNIICVNSKNHKKYLVFLRELAWEIKNKQKPSKLRIIKPELQKQIRKWKLPTGKDEELNFKKIIGRSVKWARGEKEKSNLTLVQPFKCFKMLLLLHYLGEKTET